MKKKIIFVLLFLTTLTISIIIIVNITPRPISFLVNRLFNNPKYYVSIDYRNAKKNVTVINNIKYTSKFKNNRYDVYSPNIKITKKIPTIIWVHGGAFVGGDKNDIKQYATILASKNYNVITMNYQVAPNAKYPTPVMQLNELISELKRIGSSENIDLTKLYLAGDSAGAHIVSQYATIQTNPDYAKKMNIKGILTKNDIDGLLLYCGVYDIEKITKTEKLTTKFFFNQIAWSYLGQKNWHENSDFDTLSVINYVTNDFPTSFITDGNTTSFEDHSLELVEKLKQNNVEVKSRFYTKVEYITKHEYQFHLDTNPGKKTLQDTFDFLNIQSKK